MLKKAEIIAKKLNFEYKGSAILVKQFNSIDEAEKFQTRLIKNGIFAPVIRPPTVQKPTIRVSIHL